MMARVSAITRSSSTTNMRGLAGWPLLDVKSELLGRNTLNGDYNATLPLYQRCWPGEKSNLGKANPEAFSQLLTCFGPTGAHPYAPSSLAGVVCAACGGDGFCPAPRGHGQQPLNLSTNTDSARQTNNSSSWNG